MKSLVIIVIMVAMTVAYPDRERRSVVRVPVVAPATTVIGPKAVATVVGPAAGAIVAAPVPAVIAGTVGAVVAPGVHVPEVVVDHHVW